MSFADILGVRTVWYADIPPKEALLQKLFWGAVSLLRFAQTERDVNVALGLMLYWYEALKKPGQVDKIPRSKQE